MIMKIMLMDMIKTKKDDNEVVTKGWFREAFREGIDELAILINKSFVGVESRMGQMESHMAKQEDLLALTERVKAIEITVYRHDKELMNIHGDFNMVIQELKSIRARLDQMEKSDNSIDVVNLDLRVRKLEKRAKL